METPLSAMFWELWRTSRAELALRLGFSCAAVLLIVVVSSATQTYDPELRVIRGIVVALLIVTSSSASTWIQQFDRQAGGFSLSAQFHASGFDGGDCADANAV